jgi:hypothetical protein
MLGYIGTRSCWDKGRSIITPYTLPTCFCIWYRCCAHIHCFQYYHHITTMTTLVCPFFHARSIHLREDIHVKEHIRHRHHLQVHQPHQNSLLLFASLKSHVAVLPTFSLWAQHLSRIRTAEGMLTAISSVVRACLALFLFRLPPLRAYGVTKRTSLMGPALIKVGSLVKISAHSESETTRPSSIRPVSFRFNTALILSSAAAV